MNLPTIIVAAIVAAVLVSIVVISIRNKKKGKGHCGSGCGSCGIKDSCH